MSEPGQTVALVACAATKGPTPAPARDLYRSALFRKSLRYAEGLTNRVFVLSAEHGLVDPDEVLAPYDVTLGTFSAAEVRVWGSYKHLGP